MEILLTETVEKLGEVGEVVKVADGYARNYLFPKGLGIFPTEHNKKRFEGKRKERMTKILEKEEKAKYLKEKLDEIILEFARPAHGSKLYGSVRRRDIVEGIEEETGQEMERSRINLTTPIEELGAYLVEINLYKDINAEVRVRVKEEEKESAEEQKELEE